MVESDKFTGFGKLEVSGSADGETERKVTAYTSLMTVSFKNLLWAIGKYHSEDVSKETPLTNQRLIDLKATSDFLNSKV